MSDTSPGTHENQRALPMLCQSARTGCILGFPFSTTSVFFVAAHSDHASLIRDPEPAMVDALAGFLGKCAGAPT